jgi:predicted SAM-dependent methyltransferase
MLKLNLGSGEMNMTGWQNVDIADSGGGVDLSVFPWPFEDNSASEILASHILEHFTKADARLFLDECWRVLMGGGCLWLAVPDMDKFIDCKLSGDWTPLNGYHWRDLNWLLGGDLSETRPEQRHRYMYNAETLGSMCYGAGFNVLAPREFSPELDNPKYEAISLYMKAYK